MSIRLNQKLGDIRRRGTVLHLHGDHINFWSHPIATDFPILERGFLACLDAGDLVFANFIAFEVVWQAVERGDTIDEVLEFSQRYAAFARDSRNDAVHQTIRLEQQFLACLKGLTRERTTFADESFQEAPFLATVTDAAFMCGVVFYHVMKLIAAYLFGDEDLALVHATEAKRTLSAAMAMPMEATFYFFHALVLARIYARAEEEERREILARLGEHSRKLGFWAKCCPENFLAKHALVSAEIARITGDALAAEQRYEEAIRAARDNGFVHWEALANELAAVFYRERGLETAAGAYLREAVHRYARWGADAKVKQLEQRHPTLLDVAPMGAAATFAARAEQLDLLSVTKAAQTISGEIVLDRLVRTLLEVVLAQGGAQTVCLILCRNRSLFVEAEAALVPGGTVASILASVPLDACHCVPVSLVHYVQRMKERVILSNAAADAGKFAGDDYFARKRPISVLCLPILRQAEVVGLLYLENNLLVGAFTLDRLAALELLATQAAISLQIALLIAEERAARAAAEDAERRAAFLAEAGVVLSESLDYEETFARLGSLCARSLACWCVIDVVEGRELRRIAGAHVDPEKMPALDELLRRYPSRWDSDHPSATVLRTGQPLLLPELTDELLRSRCEDEQHFRLLRALGGSSAIAVPLLARGETLGVLTIVSATPTRPYGRADLELAEEVALRAASAIDNARLYRASQEAVRVRSEFMTVASHELNTPVTSLMLAVQALRRATPTARPIDAGMMDRLLAVIARQGERLTKLVQGLLDISRIEANGGLTLELASVDLGALVREVVERFESDLARARCAVSIRGDAGIVGRWDRSRLDQVLTNLLSNAIKFGAGKPIEISFGSERGLAWLAVRDHGIGIEATECGRIFGRFQRAVSERHYGGLGLGLYISRRIVEDHGGSLRCESEVGVGSTFLLDLPCAGPPGPAIGSHKQSAAHG
jgi:signal transduction histidine kinase